MTAPTFLSLPSELRKIIYECIFQDSSVTLQLETRWDPTQSLTLEILAAYPKCENTILLVCKQTHDEAWAVSRQWMRMIFRKGASAEDLRLASHQTYMQLAWQIQVRPLRGNHFDPQHFSSLKRLDVCHGRRPHRSVRIINCDTELKYDEVTNGSHDELLKAFAKVRYRVIKGFEWVEKSRRDPQRTFQMTADLAFFYKRPRVLMKDTILVGPHVRLDAPC